MNITVNNNSMDVAEPCTLQQLCNLIGIKENEPVAVAIGMDVIERGSWSSIILNENDNITIIRATCGG